MRDNTKLDIKDVRCEGVDWIDMAQDRDMWRDLVIEEVNLRDP
jgi:hypothetical protein